MKDKVLKAEITTAVEHIARALRNYSGNTMSCRIYVETRAAAHDGNDTYSVWARQKYPHTTIFDASNEIQYAFDKINGEVIIRTEALPNDTQGKA